MAVGDHRPVASDRPHSNQPLGWQFPSHGYQNNPHPTQPRNDPRLNRDQANKPYPSTYQSQPQVRPALSSELPLKTIGYGYGDDPPSIQPQAYQQADVPPPKRGNGYPDPRSNRDQVVEPYPSAYPSQPQVRPALSSKPPLKTTGYGYGDNPPLIQTQVYQQADVPSPKRGNGYPDPRSNRDQVIEPYPSTYPSQPQVRPASSSKPPLKTTGYGYGDNPPLNQPPVHQQADVPPPKRGHGYPEPRSNRDQVNEPYLSPFQNQPQGVPPPSSEPPPRTAGYDKHNPPSIQQPYVNQQADGSLPRHGNGYPEPRPNGAQVKGHYSSPKEREEGGYGGSNGVGHQQPPTEAKLYEDRQQNPPPVVAKPNQPHGSPAVHGNREKNRLDCYTNPTQPQETEAHRHGRGNYQSDQFTVLEHNPPSFTVEPHIPATVSVSGYPASNVTASVNPQTHSQGQPYQDHSTEGHGFVDPSKGRLNAIKPKKVPSDAIPPAGAHVTGQGHPHEQSSPHKGNERSPVSPLGRHNLNLTLNLNVGPPAAEAPARTSDQPNKGSRKSGKGGCCSIL